MLFKLNRLLFSPKRLLENPGLRPKRFDPKFPGAGCHGWPDATPGVVPTPGVRTPFAFPFTPTVPFAPGFKLGFPTPPPGTPGVLLTPEELNPVPEPVPVPVLLLLFPVAKGFPAVLEFPVP
ncbi:MAG TPA: hypothetical protein VIV82_01535, partial [Verrucomicrobiae bacterium]